VDETPITTPPSDNIDVETNPTEQLNKEWQRIHQLRASNFPWKETRWAQYLDVDPMDTDEDDDDTQTTPCTDGDIDINPLSTKERRRLEERILRQHRDEEGEVLLTLAIAEADAHRRQERRSIRNAKSRERKARKS